MQILILIYVGLQIRRNRKTTLLLEFQQGTFALETTSVADKITVGSDHAVAGDYDGYGVAANGSANGLCGMDIEAAG